jgi:hypothetical protein
VTPTLMVIFGAGASYDSCSSFPPETRQIHEPWQRPPLAKELFLPVPQFRVVSQQYSRLQPLLAYLESQENVEEILEEFRTKAEKDTECRSQLMAIQYYLRQVIRSCQRSWTEHTYGASNYKTLLDQVRSYPRVCFVTFNYDTMMESALEGIDVPLQKIGDYVSHRKYSLIKLHGSIDWWQWIPKVTTRISQNEQPDEQTMIRAAPVVGERCVVDRADSEPPSAYEYYFFLPALAIPTVSKHTFVCPPEHVEALNRLIPEVTQIAIVGWRAGERNFLKMLKEGLRNPVRVIAACANVAEAEATLGRLRAEGINGDFKATPGGFTEFVVNRRIESFLGAS